MLSYLLLYNKRLEFDFFFKSTSKIPTGKAKPTRWKFAPFPYYHREKPNLKSLSEIKNLGFIVLKYIVLTFCWHSIEASAAFAF